ncbi:MAG: xanthine dehydrogenase small subunit [Gammaproteobacteria bacterium]|jgi:xanthine dehydrogenase small subunit
MKNCVRFILDGELVEIENLDPTRTVLQYLREDLRRVGSKEGCAEGDCGACTVVIGALVDDRIQFRSVNACIQFLPTLDGKMLFTVESLKTRHGQLHPVQQSLVDCHASQCGFCTPGFVMSMFALYKTNPNIDRLSIDDALSGNLCRCTGYRPIIDACMKMTNYPVQDDSNPLLFESASNQSSNSKTEISDQEQQAIHQLRQIKRSEVLTLKIGQRHYHAPNSVNELAQIYADSPDSYILAGGTDVGLWVTKQLRQLDDIIYLGHIKELNRIEQSSSFIKIGAAVSLTDSFDALSRHYPELNQLFRRFSSVPVRNAGTLVGNVANGSPIGDSMPALICMGARVALRQGQQSREMDLQDFYIDYQKNMLQAGEFIEAVLVPVKDKTWQLRSYKLCKRFDQDISAVCAAFSIQFEESPEHSQEQGKIVDIRIAFGGMAAIPKRATQAEAMLKDQLWNEGSVHQAMAALSQDFTPLSDMRASKNYRQQTAANLLYRFYLETRQNDALTNDQLDVFDDRAAVHG